MPQFSPGIQQSQVDTPQIDLENTTAKKLDFEVTDLIMNRQRLHIDALSDRGVS